MSLILFFSLSSEIFEPYPVTVFGLISITADIIAEETVVFAIPISPSKKILQPALIAFSANCLPIFTDCFACAFVIA